MNRNLSKKNMKIKLLTVLLIGLTPTLTIAEPKETDPRILESRKVIKEFAGKLKKELVQAMEEGGPVNAIKVCNIEAPGIAAGLSDKYQWRIGRTSLKTRNSNNNPDDWELDVLQQFEQLLKESGDEAQGSDRVARARMAEATIKKLEYAEETEDGFRYMKAIPTQPLCLTCHGDNIQEPLKQTLSELYPEDKATGFKVGDLRGAFSILQSK